MPNEIWHLDVTVLRLLDGTKLYLHAVLDYFSRRILAWHLAEKLSPSTTCLVLAGAAKHLRSETGPVSVITDSGLSLSCIRAPPIPGRIAAGARKSNEPLQRPELGSSKAERACLEHRRTR